MMERDLAGDLWQTALQQPKLLQRVDGMHRALQRQMRIISSEELDGLLDDELPLGSRIITQDV
jgi:hypothetical protein